MTVQDVDTRLRIDKLVEAVRHDRTKSRELFQYVWTMMCVRNGLLRVVQESSAGDLLLEEVRTGSLRAVSRPVDLDGDIEALAVQALARLLKEGRRPG